MKGYNFYKNLRVIWPDDHSRILDGISEKELREKFKRYQKKGYIGHCQWHDKKWKILGEKRVAWVSFDFTKKECERYAGQKESEQLQEDMRLFAILSMEKYGTRELEDILIRTKKVLRLTDFGNNPEGIFQDETLMQPRICPELMGFFLIFKPYQHAVMIDKLVEYMEKKFFPNLGLFRIHYQSIFRLEKELEILEREEIFPEAAILLAYMHFMRNIPLQTKAFCQIPENITTGEGDEILLHDLCCPSKPILVPEPLIKDVKVLLTINESLTPCKLVELLEEAYQILKKKYVICTNEQLAERYGKRTLADTEFLHAGECLKLALPMIRLLSVIAGKTKTQHPATFLKMTRLPVELTEEAWAIHTEKAIIAEKMEQ